MDLLDRVVKLETEAKKSMRMKNYQLAIYLFKKALEYIDFKLYYKYISYCYFKLKDEYNCVYNICKCYDVELKDYINSLELENE